MKMIAERRVAPTSERCSDVTHIRDSWRALWEARVTPTRGERLGLTLHAQIAVVGYVRCVVTGAFVAETARRFPLFFESFAHFPG